ncbi:MAG: hypothetical protein BalsKO_26290 [Balneolaceae bacterium]
MHNLIVKKTINASVEQVWSEIKDFGGIHKVHPLIEKSPVTNGIEFGNGAERTCIMYSGGEIKERVFDYVEGEKYSVEVIDPGPFPIEKSFVEISIADAGKGNSSLSFNMKFQPKFGVIGTLMAKTVMKKQFEKILGDVITGLETHIKTGKLIGKKGVLIAA